ncbi:MAG: long-subunit fatty acid transport protein [Parvicella sp.]|jgi:long-subunit fatty acid transport protein
MQIKLIKTTLLILLFMVAIGSSTAQSEYDTVVIQDMESWTAAKFQLKVNKKLKFQLSQQLRLKHNSSELERTFTQLKGEYKINSNFSFGAGYRFILEQKSTDFLMQHRFQFDGAYSFKLERFRGDVRLRYQSVKVPSLESKLADNHLRGKFEIGYNIKSWKLDPYVSTEIFRQVVSDYTTGFDKIRFQMGTTYDFNKKHSISAFYGFEKELNELYPKITYLFGVSYKYKLKLKKNED